MNTKALNIRLRDKMKCYDEFKKMMLAVAEEIASEHQKNNQPVYITCSGGLDSLSTVLAIKEYTDNIILLHWNRGRGRYDDMLTAITTYISERLHMKMKRIEAGQNFYVDFAREGIKRFVFSDGFDIAFNEIYEIYPDHPQYPYGKTLSVSYGERFRCHHPFLDVLCHISDRFIAWRCSKDVSGYERLMSDIYLEKKYRDRDGLDLDVIDYDGHPLFVDFFWEYYMSFSEIFRRKKLVQMFIKDILGISHNELCRKAWREYC